MRAVGSDELPRVKRFGTPVARCCGGQFGRRRRLRRFPLEVDEGPRAWSLCRHGLVARVARASEDWPNGTLVLTRDAASDAMT